MQLNLAIPRRRRLISLTPLIDVVFILLLFFMLASNFIEWRAIALNTPAHSASSSATKDRAVLVRLARDGSIDLNGQVLTLQQLGEQLQPFLNRNPKQAVLVQPSADTELQTLVNLLDKLTAIGVQNLTLQEHRSAQR